MGMFDTVFAPCPECGKLIGFQSKAGECNLNRYKHTNVPAEIASDLIRTGYDNEPLDTQTCCEKVFRLKATVPRVSMIIEECSANEEEDWD